MLRPQFDVTPEAIRTTPGAQAGTPVVAAGTVLDQNRVPAGPLTLPLGSLNRHVFVCGAAPGNRRLCGTCWSRPRQRVSRG